VATPTVEAGATSAPATAQGTDTNTPSAAATTATGASACAGIALRTVNLDTMGLPYSWQPNCVPATPYDNSQPPGPTGLPQHLQINFGSLKPEDVKPNDPIIYVIPVAEYEKMWNDNNNPAVSATLTKLSTLLKDKPGLDSMSSMPVLPFERVTGSNDLSVHGKYLSIQSGEGVRFVGRFAQSPVPVSNDNPQLFYIYQGYSPDSTYLVSFFYPVSTSSLPRSADVAAAERQEVDADPTAYMSGKAQELNALHESDWSPNLSQLDAVIDSLEFGN
jgi:hypothetical protein